MPTASPAPFVGQDQVDPAVVLTQAAAQQRIIALQQSGGLVHDRWVQLALQADSRHHRPDAGPCEQGFGEGQGASLERHE